MGGAVSEVQADSGEWLKSHAPDLGAWVAVGDFESGDVQDLGTIILHANPSLVSGEVWIKGSSQKVRGRVTVLALGRRSTRFKALERYHDSLNPRLIAKATIGSLSNSQRSASRKLFDLESPNSRMGPAGRYFGISGVYKQQRIRLEISATGADDEETYVPNGIVETKVGTRGLKIELVRAVKIEGLIKAASMDKLGPSAEERRLEAVFYYRDGRESRLPVDRFGNFQGSVPPGLVDVVITRPGETGEMTRIHSVFIDLKGSHTGKLNSVVLD